MARVTSTTSKSINLPQLASELGGAAIGGPDMATCLSNASKEVWADDITQTALNNAITAHTADITFGIVLNPFVVTLNGGQPIVWTNMPLALTGASGTQTKIPMHTSRFARLTADVLVQGSTNAVLIGQVSLDGSAWVSGPQVSISSTGLKVSTLTVIPAQYQTDVFFRIAGQGGNGTADPSFGLVTIQFA